MIVIDPKEFPRIEEMPVYWWFAQIQRGTMDAARAINKTTTGLPRKPGKGSGHGRKPKSVSLLDMDDDELDQQLGAPVDRG